MASVVHPQHQSELVLGNRYISPHSNFYHPLPNIYSTAQQLDIPIVIVNLDITFIRVHRNHRTPPSFSRHLHHLKNYINNLVSYSKPSLSAYFPEFHKDFVWPRCSTPAHPTHSSHNHNNLDKPTIPKISMILGVFQVPQYNIPIPLFFKSL